MTHAFLSVDAASGGALARSAIDRAQRDLSAIFEERDGWLVAVTIPGEDEHEAVGVADLSAMTKIEVRPAGAAIEGDGVVWYPISERRGLVLCPPSQGDAVRGQVGDRFSLDVTGAWSVIGLAGPEAETVLRRMTHLHHFPSGGEIAHVQGHVLERDGAYWILVAQEYGQYVWDVAVDRASALGGGAVGADGLARYRGGAA